MHSALLFAFGRTFQYILILLVCYVGVLQCLPRADSSMDIAEVGFSCLQGDFPQNMFSQWWTSAASFSAGPRGKQPWGNKGWAKLSHTKPFASLVSLASRSIVERERCKGLCMVESVEICLSISKNIYIHTHIYIYTYIYIYVCVYALYYIMSY
jgi:hypothetical protein